MPTTFLDHPRGITPALAQPGVLVLRVTGPLSGPLVDRLQTMILSAPPDTTDVVIDARAVTALDPVGVARLWLFCDRSEALRRRRVRLGGLDQALARTLRQHPLRAFMAPDDILFEDPFASLAPSAR